MQAQPPAGPPPPPVTPVFGWYIPAPPPPPPTPYPGGGLLPYPPGGPQPYPAGGPAPYPPVGPPPYGPGWYPPMPWFGPVRPPSFAKVPHPRPEPFLRLMRTVNYRWWRPILGLLAFLGSYVVFAVLVAFAFLAAGVQPNLLQLDDLTDPLVLALANASLIVAIPAVWLAGVAHTERIGWPSSVLGRIRWRLLWRYALLALPVMGAGILLSLAVSGGIGPTTGFDGSEYLLLVIIVVSTTPLQSAAEEYVFRGYLSQAIGAWIPSRAVGAIAAALITATLFSLAHAPGDWFTFLDRFAFGLAASAVVWLTGGLEAAIALHAANNVVIFLVVGALGGSTSSDIQAGSAAAALVVALDILVMGLYVWLVAATRKRWHPELLSQAAEPTPPGVSPGPMPNHWGGPPPGWGTGPPAWIPPPPEQSPPLAPAMVSPAPQSGAGSASNPAVG